MLGQNGFTLLHIAISLLALASGFVVLGGLLAGTLLRSCVQMFLLTSVATNVTGLMFPFARLLPSHIVAVIALLVLAVALYAFYSQRLQGGWSATFAAAAVASLYFNVFVLIAQTFAKNPSLAALAPTQSEPPFAVAQIATLLAFVWVGWSAVARTRSAHA